VTWLDDLTLETVIVHVNDGPSLKGLKQAVYGDGLLLRDVMTLEDPPAMLNGVVFVPRERVVLLQLVETRA
jgi:hypothetical protein